MNELIYPRERTLGAITLVLGLLAWVGLIVGTFGLALLVLAIGFVLYLFVQSALIAHIKGNGVALSEAQFPDLHGQFVACCERLEIKKPPQAYVLNGNGGLNAFATKFLGTQYLVLLSDVVDAMDAHEDGVRFYIGHELGHLRLKHLSGSLMRWPVLWLPLLGAAYSRAKESSCDRHGLACSRSPQHAARALAALSAGSRRWQGINLDEFRKQADRSSGFWMSFHELIGAYPWLTKRAARLLNTGEPVPGRNSFAYLLALFVPYAGRLGGGFAVLILIYIVGVLAAIAIPAYTDFTARAHLQAAVIGTDEIRAALGHYYEDKQATPESLQQLGIAEQLPDGSRLSLDAGRMILSVATRYGQIVFTPSIDDQNHIFWTCAPGEGTRPQHLPPSCRSMGAPAQQPR